MTWPSFSLYILYVLSVLVRHCYRLFLLPPPRGLVDGSLYHFVLPHPFVSLFHTIGSYILSCFSNEATPSCLVGLLVFVASLNIKYTTTITLMKVFLLAMGL